MSSLAREKKKIYLPDVIGKGYGAFWRFKGRYRVCKGSRASKKSKTTALYYITKMMKHPEANLLVVRKVERTLRGSCFAELVWAIHRLGVEDHWDWTLNPLEMTYKPTGQKIYFRGLDDPLKVTSIAVSVGVLCWLWIEEAYEISKEADFDMLDESIRGVTPPGLFKQITLTFNPWNEKIWIRKRFFCDVVGHDENGEPIYKERKEPISADGQILAITTTFQCNEWLDEADLKLFEEMRKNRPKRFWVAGLGNWGISEGLVYDNWKEESFDHTSTAFQAEHPGMISAFGLDFGYTNDPSALFCGLLDKKKKQLFVFDEMYQKGMSNKRIADTVTEMGYAKEKIVGDSAEPKSIDELKGHGLRMKSAKKGKDSVKNGIQWIQDLEIIVHPRCVNFLTEISNYTWETDKFGTRLNVPVDDFNHLMDAMRYALESHIGKKGWAV